MNDGDNGAVDIEGEIIKGVKWAKTDDGKSVSKADKVDAAGDMGWKKGSSQKINKTRLDLILN